jgi:hypothetical protein
MVEVFDGDKYCTSRVVVVYAVLPGAFWPNELPGREILCCRSSNKYSRLLSYSLVGVCGDNGLVGDSTRTTFDDVEYSDRLSLVDVILHTLVDLAHDSETEE